MEQEYYLALTGKVNIERPLQLDHDYQITGPFSVYGLTESSKQDGTTSVTFKGKFNDSVSLISDGGDVMVGKKTTGLSNTLYKRLYGKGVEYKDFMPFIMQDSVLDELIEWFEKSEFYRE